MRKFFCVALSLLQFGCFSMSGTDFSSKKSDQDSLKDYFPVWTFNDFSTIESIVRNQLGVTGATAEETEVLNYLRSHQAELGAGNFAQGKPDNPRPEPGKFKFLTEVYADACYVGLAKTTTRANLFPTISSNADWNSDSFKQIYLKVMGREPSESEKKELLALVNKLPGNSNPPYLKKAAGACTVVLSSLEASNSR